MQIQLAPEAIKLQSPSVICSGRVQHWYGSVRNNEISPDPAVSEVSGGGGLCYPVTHIAFLSPYLTGHQLPLCTQAL